jgi:hypothetical protein
MGNKIRIIRIGDIEYGAVAERIKALIQGSLK